MTLQLEPGLTASITLAVTSADTAKAVGSGDVPVLATPRALALLEAATVAAVAPVLAADQTSVGVRVELDHLAATPVGRTVVGTATLTETDGRKLTFEVSLTDGETLAAQGIVHRVVIDRQRFLDRL